MTDRTCNLQVDWIRLNASAKRSIIFDMIRSGICLAPLIKWKSSWSCRDTFICVLSLDVAVAFSWPGHRHHYHSVCHLCFRVHAMLFSSGQCYSMRGNTGQFSSDQCNSVQHCLDHFTSSQLSPVQLDSMISHLIIPNVLRFTRLPCISLQWMQVDWIQLHIQASYILWLTLARPRRNLMKLIIAIELRQSKLEFECQFHSELKFRCESEFRSGLESTFRAIDSCETDQNNRGFAWIARRHRPGKLYWEPFRGYSAGDLIEIRLDSQIFQSASNLTVASPGYSNEMFQYWLSIEHFNLVLEK
jgi:hypothetical protein